MTTEASDRPKARPGAPLIEIRSIDWVPEMVTDDDLLSMQGSDDEVENDEDFDKDE